MHIHPYIYTYIHIHTYIQKQGRRRGAGGRWQPRQRTDRDGKGLTGGSRQDGDDDGGLVGEGLRAQRGLGEERLGGGDDNGDDDGEDDVDDAYPASSSSTRRWRPA